MFDLSYEARLRQLNLYSLQMRRDRYQIIYIWKIIESKVANLEPPIQTTRSPRLGRFCVKKTVPRGHAGTLMYNSFRWNAIRFFNILPASIRNFSGIDISVFKRNLDYFLCSVKDVPYESFSDNSTSKQANKRIFPKTLWWASCAGRVTGGSQKRTQGNSR